MDSKAQNTQSMRATASAPPANLLPVPRLPLQVGVVPRVAEAAEAGHEGQDAPCVLHILVDLLGSGWGSGRVGRSDGHLFKLHELPLRLKSCQAGRLPSLDSAQECPSAKRACPTMLACLLHAVRRTLQLLPLAIQGCQCGGCHVPCLVHHLQQRAGKHSDNVWNQRGCQPAGGERPRAAAEAAPLVAAGVQVGDALFAKTAATSCAPTQASLAYRLAAAWGEAISSTGPRGAGGAKRRQRLPTPLAHLQAPPSGPGCLLVFPLGCLDDAGFIRAVCCAQLRVRAVVGRRHLLINLQRMLRSGSHPE